MPSLIDTLGVSAPGNLGVGAGQSSLQRELDQLKRQLAAAQAAPPTPAPAPAAPAAAPTPTLQPFSGDLRRYGEAGGEHPWFSSTLGPNGPVQMGGLSPPMPAATMPSLASALGLGLPGGQPLPTAQPGGAPAGGQSVRDLLRRLYPDLFGGVGGAPAA